MRRLPRPDGVARVDFLKTKYGRELLVDASMTSQLRDFDRGGAPHTLTFFDILLVTAGRGTFELDGTAHPVRPGEVFFTRPGEVRVWRADGLEGACLFFAAGFVGEIFADPRILDAFGYFAPHRPSARVRLAPAQRRAFLSRFTQMLGEFHAPARDSGDVLRASLYELLVLLNRWYVAAHGAVPRPAAGSVVDRFTRLVERDYRTRQRVSDYADELGLTPGHLNALCRSQAGRSAGAIIRSRVITEARRLLRYSDQPASQVGYLLGFGDPAYFTRFFRRETGMTPTGFRATAS